jgi:hypothetical protein
VGDEGVPALETTASSMDLPWLKRLKIRPGLTSRILGLWVARVTVLRNPGSLIQPLLKTGVTEYRNPCHPGYEPDGCREVIPGLFLGVYPETQTLDCQWVMIDERESKQRESLAFPGFFLSSIISHQS